MEILSTLAHCSGQGCGEAASTLQLSCLNKTDVQMCGVSECFLTQWKGNAERGREGGREGVECEREANTDSKARYQNIVRLHRLTGGT